MAFLRIIILSLLVNSTHARELPWIGVSITSPAAGDPSQPDLKLGKGVGLKVARVAPGGPLAKAGGKAGDFWWKFEDQILVNKSQMLVLLGEKSPGDELKIQFFREGSLQSLKLTLGTEASRQAHLAADRAKHPEAMTFLEKRERRASTVVKKTSLSLEKEGEGWRFKVSEDGTNVYSALVTEDNLSELVPQKWQASFKLLKVTLENQEITSSEAPHCELPDIPKKETPKE